MKDIKKSYYVVLPDLQYASRKSIHEYKYAVLARYRLPESKWEDWGVARWSASHDLANKYAKYLSSGCPSVKDHYYEIETKVVPVQEVDY